MQPKHKYPYLLQNKTVTIYGITDLIPQCFVPYSTLAYYLCIISISMLIQMFLDQHHISIVSHYQIMTTYSLSLGNHEKPS